MKNTKKVVINVCYGGFDLSDVCLKKLEELKSLKGIESYYIRRDDEDLIQAIEEVGIENASKGASELEIVEIPNDVDWEITEYDGWENLEWEERMKLYVVSVVDESTIDEYTTEDVIIGFYNDREKAENIKEQLEKMLDWDEDEDYPTVWIEEFTINQEMTEEFLDSKLRMCTHWAFR